MKFKIIIEFRQEYNMEYTHTIWCNDEIEEDEIQEEMGIRQELDRNSTGIRQELDRNSTGIRQELDRNSTGTRHHKLQSRRKISIPYAFN